MYLQKSLKNISLNKLKNKFSPVYSLLFFIWIYYVIIYTFSSSRGAALAAVLTHWSSVLFHVLFITCKGYYKTTWTGERLSKCYTHKIRLLKSVCILLYAWRKNLHFFNAYKNVKYVKFCFKDVSQYRTWRNQMLFSQCVNKYKSIGLQTFVFYKDSIALLFVF